MAGWFSRRLRRDREDGAALVEFALILPLLMVLLLGMIDAGWAFSHHLEVRHGAREGARLAAVSNTPFVDAATIAAETCARMSSTSPDVSVEISLPEGVEVGKVAKVRVVWNHDALTGFIPILDNLLLTSEVEVRLEQDGTGVAGGPIPCG